MQPRLNSLDSHLIKEELTEEEFKRYEQGEEVFLDYDRMIEILTLRNKLIE